MKKINEGLNRCDIYVSIWCLYLLQDILYPQGYINQILQFVVIFWSLVVSCKYLFKWYGNTMLLKSANLLVFMFTVYGIIYLYSEPVVFVFGGSPASYYYLQYAYNSLLPIYVFYHYSKLGYLTETKIKIYFLALFLIAIPNYFLNYSRLLNANQYGKTEFTNNVGYTFLSLFPMVVFFYRRRLLQYLFSALLMIFILSSMKRGAILIGAICLLFFLITNWKTSKRGGRIFLVVLSVLLLISAIWYVEYLLDNSDYFVRRLQDTKNMDSSGRDFLFNRIIKCYWNEGSLLNLLFGYGANSTIRFAGNYAHDDWLETLCNNGIVGMMLLINWFLCIIKEVKSSRHLIDKYMFYAYVLIFLIVFLKSFFSMSIMGMELGLVILIGYLTYKTKSGHVYNSLYR